MTAKTLPPITDLEDAFVLCRRANLGHPWEPNPTAKIDSDLARAATWFEAVRCGRCGTERFRYFDSRGEVMVMYYRYPEDYKAARATGTELHLEMISRSLLVQRIQANGKVTASKPTRRMPRKR